MLFLWVLLGCALISISETNFCQVLLGFTWFYFVLLVFLGLIGFYYVILVFLGLTGFSWVLLGFTGFFYE